MMQGFMSRNIRVQRTSMSEASMTIQPIGRQVDVPVGHSIYSAATTVEVMGEAFCGGRGICGKCRVIVREGRELLNNLTDSEARFFSETDIRNGFRLACQAVVKFPGNLVVEIPRGSQVRRQRLSVVGMEKRISPRPRVMKHAV
jgi:uncharacterized 2Fe-2S/4Fe-4S cluster protein (DUF4445 family)